MRRTPGRTAPSRRLACCRHSRRLQLGWRLAPITLYPAWLERLGEASPFAAQLFWPASIAIEPSFGRFVQAVAAQLIWIGGLALVLAAIWRAGLGRFGVVVGRLGIVGLGVFFVAVEREIAVVDFQGQD